MDDGSCSVDVDGKELDDMAYTVHRDCVWEEVGKGCFETKCGHRIVLRRDDGDDDGFMYCPFCGREIREEVETDEQGVEPGA